MASQEKAVLIAISGAIYQMPPTDREKVEATAVEIRKIVDAAGDHGVVALSLVGAEKAVQEAGE